MSIYCIEKVVEMLFKCMLISKHKVYYVLMQVVDVFLYFAGWVCILSMGPLHKS